MQYIYANNLIHVGLIEQIVKLIILFLWHLNLGNTKFGAGKCAHIIFVSITSIKGTSELYSEEIKRDIFSGSGNLGLF